MQIEAYENRSGTVQAEKSPKPLAATVAVRKPSAVRGRRKSFVALLLADAMNASREYAERWLAGRGAE